MRMNEEKGTYMFKHTESEKMMDGGDSEEQ
jgi:hypothetical protein